MMNAQTISLKFSTSAELSRQVFQLVKQMLTATRLDESGRDRFMLAVGEAIDNAVIHGNKFSADKFVEVEYIQTPDRIKFMVSDQGQGFNYQKHMDTPLSEYQATNLISKTIKFGSPGGLGLALMRKCTNELVFTPPGNKVTFVKHLQPENSPVQA
jgi:serine/threonine-protein kinase RsbW